MKAVLLGLLTLAACGAFEPTGAVPFDPPASYRAVWDSVQACTGIPHYRFERLRFYYVPGVRSFPVPGEPHAAGYTRGHTITIAEWYLYHPMVVKHEMIHALLGRGDHPDIPFKFPCHATWDSYGRNEPDLAH